MKVDQVLLEHLDQVLKVPGVQAKGDGNSEFAALLAQVLTGNLEADPELEALVGAVKEDGSDLNFLLEHLAEGEVPLVDGDELTGEMLNAEAKAALLQLQQLIGQQQPVEQGAAPGESAAKQTPAAKGGAGSEVFNLNLKAAAEAAEAGSNLKMPPPEGKGVPAEKAAFQAEMAINREQVKSAEAQLKASEAQLKASEPKLKPAEIQLKDLVAKPVLTPEQAAAQEAAAKKAVEIDTGEKAAEKAVRQQPGASEAKAEDAKNMAQQKPAFEKPPVQAEGAGRDFASAVRNSEPANARPQNSAPVAEQSAIFQQPAVQGDDAVQASRIFQVPVQANNLRESIIQQLEGRMVYLRETAANPAEMRMTLHPPELGEVTIRVFSKQGRLSASIIAETPLVREILESSITELRQRMNFVSIDFEQLDFSAKEDQYSGSGKPGEGRSNPIPGQGANGRADPSNEKGDPAMQNAPPGTDNRGIDYWA